VRLARWCLALTALTLSAPGTAAAACDGGDAGARRIVSLAPNFTEMLFRIGAGEQLVGTVEYSDYPEAARAVPRVGGYHRIHLEAVLALRPDLVIAWRSGNPSDTIAHLRRLDLEVVEIEPSSLSAIADSMRRLGDLSGHCAQAQRAAAAFERRIDGISARFAGRRPVRVFYQLWNDPLQTLGGEHVVSEVIRRCGGRNIFAELPEIAPAIGVEAVLQRDPEAIIASAGGGHPPPWLDHWRRWPTLAAVRHDNLFAVDSDLVNRLSLRIADGLEQVCTAIDNARERLDPAGD
jgi:iron complex transport system substrate-binding protein